MQNDVAHTPEPEPCPFCGNDGRGPIEEALHVAMHEHDWRATSWSVQCDKCTATMGYSASEEDAIAAWNTRADAGVVRELMEALRFYARPQSWRSCGVYMSGRSQATAAEIDGGKRAADALAKAGAA